MVQDHRIICDDCQTEVTVAVKGKRPAAWGGPWRMYNPTYGEDYCPDCSMTRINKDWPSTVPFPKIGMEVYLQSRFYIDHGADDFVGGLATVNGIVLNPGCLNPTNRVMVTTVESDMQHNWLLLMEEQERLQRQFGSQRAHPDPDLHPESNKPW